MLEIYVFKSPGIATLIPRSVRKIATKTPKVAILITLAEAGKKYGI